MAQAKRKVPQEIPEAGKHLVQRLKEAILISFCASAIFFFVSLVSYDPYDSGWSNAGLNETVANNAGAVGAWCADVSLTLLGQFGYSLPLLFLAIGVVIYRQGTTGVFDDYIQIIVRLIGGIFVLIGGCGLFWFRGVAWLTTSPQNAGGIVGDLVGSTALNLFGGVGGPIILIGFFLTGTTPVSYTHLTLPTILLV